MNLGKNQQHALEFAKNYPGWHTYDWRNRATNNAILSLYAKGLVEINGYRQYRLFGDKKD
jgi:hypothetical protein